MRAFNDATVDLDDRTFTAPRRSAGSAAHTAEQEASQQYMAYTTFHGFFPHSIFSEIRVAEIGNST
jgi:hypothetical protein